MAFREGRTGEAAARERGARANNGDVLRTAALAGHGVILQPEFLVGEDVRAGRLTEILTDYTNTSIAMYAVYPHRRFLSPKVRSFVEHLEARFAAPRPMPRRRSAAAGRILSMTAKSPIEYFPRRAGRASAANAVRP